MLQLFLLFFVLISLFHLRLNNIIIINFFLNSEGILHLNYLNKIKVKNKC